MSEKKEYFAITNSPFHAQFLVGDHLGRKVAKEMNPSRFT